MARDQMVHQPFAGGSAAVRATPFGIVAIAEEADHRLPAGRAAPVRPRAQRLARGQQGPGQMLAGGPRHPLESDHALAPKSSWHRPIQYAAASASDSVAPAPFRSEEHTSELQSLMRISYAVFCLKKKNRTTKQPYINTNT